MLCKHKLGFTAAAKMFKAEKLLKQCRKLFLAQMQIKTISIIVYSIATENIQIHFPKIISVTEIYMKFNPFAALSWIRAFIIFLSSKF